jgi:hypothetical protein
MVDMTIDEDNFLTGEYTDYYKTTDNPMEFDDWLAGNDYIDNLRMVRTGDI